MDPTPSFNSERRIASSGERAAYQNFLDLTKSGHCKVRELRVARQKGSITAEQFTLLVSQLAERLEKMVGIDSLTNLFNRAFLEPQLNRIKEELNHEEGKRESKVQSVMVVFLDINKMKELNDAYPDHHTVGDKALVIVADRLKKATKREDIIFRVGGDEFIAVLPINDDNPRTLEKIFERIKHSINDDLSVDSVSDSNVSIPFSVSVGFEVLNKGDNTTAAQLLDMADKKMYEDKQKKNKEGNEKPAKTSV
jgi:diguanylate cyclase (GGDEF)-like protein